jgi:hypothetical protein
MLKICMYTHVTLLSNGSYAFRLIPPPGHILNTHGLVPFSDLGKSQNVVPSIPFAAQLYIRHKTNRPVLFRD